MQVTEGNSQKRRKRGRVGTVDDAGARSTGNTGMCMELSSRGLKGGSVAICCGARGRAERLYKRARGYEKGQARDVG